MKIKTRRGVYLDLEHSPYVYEGYKFSSLKKLDIFLRKVGERQAELSQVYGKIYRITGEDSTNNDMTAKIMKQVYNEMEYH